MAAAFEASEYRGRVRWVSEAMERAGIDTLVVFAEGNICYLTGYEGFSDYVPQVAVLRAGDRDVTLILREMDIYCAYPTVYLDHGRIESYPESYIGTPARLPAMSHNAWSTPDRNDHSTAPSGKRMVFFALRSSHSMREGSWPMNQFLLDSAVAMIASSGPMV